MMKTKSILLCAASLIGAACQEKPGTGGDAPASGRLLTTEFPPELIEGTPRPIHLPGTTGGHPVTSTACGPGTEGVFHLPPSALPDPQPMAHFPPRPPMPPVATVGPPWQPDAERYAPLRDNRWQTADAPLSTFSVDVDTASYTNVRRLVLDGRPVPPDAVRLEEMVNYFDYDYPQPDGDHPFAVHTASARCPWNPDRQLVRVALKGREIGRAERPSANLVFLIDVSGSMQDSRKLPLVVDSLQVLLEELDGSDTLAVAVYAGADGLVVPPTACDADGRARIMSALHGLSAGGSTNGGAGIRLAYQLARERFHPGGVNRVILATDGDFNVGVTGTDDLVDLVADQARSGIDLTVLGVGTGNLNDAMLEAITNRGNGACHYLDSPREARRLFLEKMTGTLVTIARDVKVQVEFNPQRVRGYRLLGYANRMLHARDFSDDRIDAGDIGSGHTVTAFYEVETTTAPTGGETLRYGSPAAADDAEWLTVKLRYKRPGEDRSILLEHPFTGTDRDLAEADADFRFATAVAMTAMILRRDEELRDCRTADAAHLAAHALGSDPHGRRADFTDLLGRLSAR